MDDLWPFDKGYIKALLESVSENPNEVPGVAQGPFTVEDLALATIAHIKMDCANYCVRYLADQNPVFEQGYNFGKWRFSKECVNASNSLFPPLNIFIGEDSKIYFEK